MRRTRVAASFDEATQSLLNVPIFISSADAMPKNSSTSSSECAIAGEQPDASNTFAIMSMDTKFVIHCTKGFASATWVINWHADSAVGERVAMRMKAQVTSAVVGRC